MNERDDLDRQIGELFAAARRADRTKAPEFHALVTPSRTAERAPRRSDRGWFFGLGFMTATAGLAVVAAAIWLHEQSPQQIPTRSPGGNPPVERQVPQDRSSSSASSPGQDRLDERARGVAAEEGPIPDYASLPDAGDLAAQPKAGSESVSGVASPPPADPSPAEVEALPRPGLVSVPAEAAPRSGADVKPPPPPPPPSRPGSTAESSAAQGVEGARSEPTRPGRKQSARPRRRDSRSRRREPAPRPAPKPRPEPRPGTPEVVASLIGPQAQQLEPPPSREVSTDHGNEPIGDLPVPGRIYQNVLTLMPEGQDERGAATTQYLVGIPDAPPPALPGGHEQRLVEATDPAWNTETYDPIRENDFVSVADHPLSTFSIDVDTASYANVRRFLSHGKLPPPDAVRIEELINYFSYDYDPPTGGDPFSVHVEVAGCPWNPQHRLARIGLMGRESIRAEYGGSNLVFLVDVSGSMRSPRKLPLLRSALGLLVDQLDGRDRIAIVTYADGSDVLLPSTPGDAKAEIQAIIGGLQASGSTNGGAGLAKAYRIARENSIPGGVNRVILATDGDFNVGTTHLGDLLRMIERDARGEIFLTVLGFGTGNLKDATLERLADRGDGNYAYVDDLREARKILVEQIGGTLVTIAKDVKIQVEFNPAQVGAYRLIGYENRLLRKQDFNDDRRDAGEIGAGHCVTALYEIVPPDAGGTDPSVDPLKYQLSQPLSEAADSGELLTLKLRYKESEETDSRLQVFPVVDGGRSLAEASEDFKFACAVAAFGMMLRDPGGRVDLLLGPAEELSLEGIGRDEGGYRSEFRDLVRRAADLVTARPSD